MRSSFGWLWCGVWLLSGCTCFEALTLRSQSPEEEEVAQPLMVGDLALPFGMFPIHIEGVGLVTGLSGTGGDVGPSPQRAALLDDMKARGVTNPNALLSSKNTALVLVHGVLRPGIRKGDRFDIEVRVPGRSEVTSLRGGWLMETRLRTQAVLGNQIREGPVLALAQGPIMIDPAAEGKKDGVMLTRGRVLGGGVALRSRDLGLVLRPAHQNVINSSRIAVAVNKRFHTFQRGVQTGVAKAKTDKFVELAVHPQYKENIARYLRVVQAIPLQETEYQRMQRIERLKEQLADPDEAFEAAIQLEAIGKPGVEALLDGLNSESTEVRFYAAEALAYLDQREAAGPLGEIALHEPAFRVFALTALSTMGDYLACEQLRRLLDAPGVETRYGAFRALWTMNPNDPLVRGERLGEQFSYHVLDTTGPNMIHVTHNRRAEVVLFGRDQRFVPPLVVNAGNNIMVTSIGPDEIAVSKFLPDVPDEKRVVSTRVDEVIRAIAELGGTYPDVVQALQEAKLSGALPSRFEVDALPRVGRTYHRRSPGQIRTGTKETATPASPAGELFLKKTASGREDSEAGEATADLDPDDSEGHNDSPRSPTWRQFLGRIVGAP